MNRRMMEFAFFGFVCAMASSAVAQQKQSNAEVKWLRSAADAARVASATGKPILVYVRSEHCHYCDLLQKKTWQNPETRAMIMREMIPLKLTLEENPEAVEAMQVKGYPSTILFSANHEYLARIDGFVSPEEFQSRIAKVKLTMQADLPSEPTTR